MEEGTFEGIPAEIDEFYGQAVYTENILYLEECPECGMNAVTRTGRCGTCSFCGWSACSM